MKSDNKKNEDEENILLFQGGGSLGAYECGVSKTLAKHKVWFDIIGGTSIGAVNAAVLVSNIINHQKAKTDNNNTYNNGNSIEYASKILEQFWYEMENTVIPQFIAEFFPFKSRNYLAALYFTIYGHPKAFLPVWYYPQNLPNLVTFNLPYLYDSSIFKNILNKYIIFENLKKQTKEIQQKGRLPRLILSTTNIKTAKPVSFDTNQSDITIDHVRACVGYPFYNISWSEINGNYLWDGSLIRNDPLKLVLELSPYVPKKIYICDVYSNRFPSLPKNIFESWHRARDIVFIDKLFIGKSQSDQVKKYRDRLEDLYDIVTNSKLSGDMSKKFSKIKSECDELIKRRGIIIKDLIHIVRKEKPSSLFEDADFSLSTIKEYIEKGEKDADIALLSHPVNS